MSPIRKVSRNELLGNQTEFGEITQRASLRRTILLPSRVKRTIFLSDPSPLDAALCSHVHPPIIVFDYL